MEQHASGFESFHNYDQTNPNLCIHRTALLSRDSQSLSPGDAVSQKSKKDLPIHHSLFVQVKCHNNHDENVQLFAI
jgi:hypothetical protein